MNVIESKEPLRVIAKTCGWREKGNQVTYYFIDAYHSLCLNKKISYWQNLRHVKDYWRKHQIV